MKSPLNIKETAERYSLDEELKTMLVEFDDFIWQDCDIHTVEQIVAFEEEYQTRSKDFDLLYDSEIEEFGAVETHDGPLCLLCKGRFQQLSEDIESNEFLKAFIDAGLSDVEALVLGTFRADLSELYRRDAYYFGIPPFAQCLCSILNEALSKLPAYSDWVVRTCNEYDKADMAVGDTFCPRFCLTTSADLGWKNNSKHRYRIKPLTDGRSRARAMFLINDNTEQQVTFLQDASFLVLKVNDWGEGKKEFVMEEQG